MADAAQVLPVLRDVLVEHMNGPDFGPWYQVERAVYLDRHAGRVIGDEEIIAGDVLGGLLLTMRDGSEYRLTLVEAVVPIERGGMRS